MTRTRVSISAHRPPTAAGRFRARRLCRRGFTFTEVMFAVVILGIGFVMIAAILPVAIQQTKTSADETTAGIVAESMIRTLSVDQSTNQKLFAATGNNPAAPVNYSAPVQFFGNPANTVAGTVPAPGDYYTFAQQWSAVRGSLIWPNDPRFACVPMYIRGQTAGAPPVFNRTATLIVVVTQCRAGDSPGKPDPTRYDSNDLIFTASPATLQPKQFNAVFYSAAPGQPQAIEFTAAASGTDFGAIGEGSFVVIASGPAAGARAIGNVVRLGPAIDASINKWSLAADYDMTAMPPSDRPGAGTYAVMLVGRALTDPTQPYDVTNNPYAGGVPDVAVYKTVIPVH